MVLLLPESSILSTKVILEVNTSRSYQNINKVYMEMWLVGMMLRCYALVEDVVHA
jgi:hypothetical protein